MTVIKLDLLIPEAESDTLSDSVENTDTRCDSDDNENVSVHCNAGKK